MGTIEKFTTRVQAPAFDVHRALYEALISAVDATVLDVDNPMRAEVPRAILKNRWGAKVTAHVTVPAPDVADVHWTIDQYGDKHRAILDDVLTALPFPSTVTAAPPPKLAALESSPGTRFNGAAPTMAFNGLRLDLANEVLHYRGTTVPVAGARAEVDLGAPNSRLTLTRVVLIGVFALGAKKDYTKIYVSIALADGQIIVVEGSAKTQEGTARAFATAVNNIGVRAARHQATPPQTTAHPAAGAPPSSPPAPPPPPPSVPAGWYPDAQNSALQRYWDGTVWTEHTAPAAPPASSGPARS
ncbi:DUF2510 domain-containing protein [Gordonia hirsuta]|nr:DUF2510 domain-containing protein [Gordonia hirsuta]